MASQAERLKITAGLRARAKRLKSTKKIIPGQPAKRIKRRQKQPAAILGVRGSGVGGSGY